MQERRRYNRGDLEGTLKGLCPLAFSSALRKPSGCGGKYGYGTQTTQSWAGQLVSLGDTQLLTPPFSRRETTPPPRHCKRKMSEKRHCSRIIPVLVSACTPARAKQAPLAPWLMQVGDRAGLGCAGSPSPLQQRRTLRKKSARSSPCRQLGNR